MLLQKLSPAVSDEIFQQHKSNNPTVEEIELFNNDCTESYGCTLFKLPHPSVLSEWNKMLDKSPLRAQEILVFGTLVIDHDKEVVKGWPRNSEAWLAAYAGACELIPVGKAQRKKR